MKRMKQSGCREWSRGWLLLVATVAVLALAACGGGGGGGGAPTDGPPPPALTVSQANLGFAALVSGPSPAVQSLTVSVDPAAAVSWTAAAEVATPVGGTWLSVSPSSGAAGSLLTVSATPSGLAPGAYSGTVLISASGVRNSPLVVAVGLTVLQDVAFAAAEVFPVGSGEHAMATGDFNGDGLPDLVVTNRDVGTVSVLLRTAAGSFQPKQDFGVSVDPSAVVVGDFNGDSRLDLAVANAGSDNVSILFGTGGADFGSATNFGVGSAPSSLAAADFDGDGALDLAVANRGDDISAGTVSVLLGTGTGAFGQATSFPAGFAPSAVTAGDFTGNGILDLAVANYNFNNLSSDNLAILPGDGSGGFGEATFFDAGFRLIAIGQGDFNGDGHLDLVLGAESGEDLVVLLGTGTGNFDQPALFPLAGFGGRSISVGDFDGDGALDLAVTHNCTCDSQVSVLLGAGNGTFGDAVAFDLGGSAVTAADFDGDGRLDLAVADWGSFVGVTKGVGDGTFLAARLLDDDLPHPQAVAVGDFNGDGSEDLAVVHRRSTTLPGAGDLTLFPGTGTSDFGAPLDFAVGPQPSSLAVGDFNGDSRDDLAVANEGANTVSVLSGAPTGILGPASNFVVGGLATFVAAQDLNGDGHPDLAVATRAGELDPSGAVSVLLNTGSGTFGGAGNFAVGSEPRSLAVGDLNGDGIPDLAVANRSTQDISLLLGSGNDLFQAADSFFARVLRFVAIADVNEDGRSDLLNADGSTVEIRLGAESGFEPLLAYDIGGASGIVADFNGDGILDVALAAVGSSRVSFLLGTGDGTFIVSNRNFAAAFPVAFSFGVETGSLAMGDFNGDGKLDLAASGGAEGGYVSILLGR
jgi:hypothetical protein